MGCHSNITYSTFPKQGNFIGRKVKVCFHYENQYLEGVVVRDDMEEPFLTIFKLEDGRHVLSTECQYEILPAEEKDS